VAKDCPPQTRAEVPAWIWKRYGLRIAEANGDQLRLAAPARTWLGAHATRRAALDLALDRASAVLIRFSSDRALHVHQVQHAAALDLARSADFPIAADAPFGANGTRAPVPDPAAHLAASQAAVDRVIGAATPSARGKRFFSRRDVAESILVWTLTEDGFPEYRMTVEDALLVSWWAGYSQSATPSTRSFARKLDRHRYLFSSIRR
jgi:hypothetical protein